MTRHAIVCFLLLAAPGVPGIVRAESSQGGAFRQLGYGARAFGLSGAAIALVDDENAVDWNPAGMATARRAGGVSYVSLVPGATLGQSQAVFVTPIGASGDTPGFARHAVGAMFTNLSADVSGGESYRENHLRLAYAYTPEPLVTFAIGARMFVSRSGVPGFDAIGSSIDLAGRLSLSRAWTVAMVGRDAFSRYSYDDGRDYRLEREFIVGLASRSISRLAIEADAVYSHSSWSRAAIGAESDYLFDLLALRAGMSVRRAGEARTTASFGAAARGFDGRITLDYAASFDDEEAFGTTHRFSLGVRF